MAEMGGTLTQTSSNSPSAPSLTGQPRVDRQVAIVILAARDYKFVVSVRPDKEDRIIRTPRRTIVVSMNLNEQIAAIRSSSHYSKRSSVTNEPDGVHPQVKLVNRW
jgi:hypothetical protein